MFSGKLSTLRDIQEYLSYVIKILELANKYTWESVLLYDDEFRILQHTYGFSWATDHSHLHKAVLMPRWAAHLSRNKQESPSYLSPYNNSDSGYKHHNFVTHLSSGSEICRLFNCRKGCQRPQCKFSHVCNRKVGSQACGKNHAGVSHPPDNQDQWLPSPPEPLPSLLVLSVWERELIDDPDKVFLIEGVKDGFQLLPADASIVQAEMDNYFSATTPTSKDKVESSILEEIEAGNYAITTHKPTIISALGAVPKPDSDEIRLIHDCSMPPSLGVNITLPLKNKRSKL